MSCQSRYLVYLLLLFAGSVAMPAAEPTEFAPPPAVGVHPRVLISPSELPVLRQRLETTACGRRAIACIRQWQDYAVHRQEAPLGKVYAGFVEGRPEAYTEAENDWWRNQIPLALCFEAFDALITDDAPRGERCGRALTAYATLSGGVHTPHGHKSINPDYLLGLAYDFAYNYMSESDRNTVRQVIATATVGKESHGMGTDFKPEDRNYNWMPHGTALLLLALSIEGEEGYDATILPKSFELMRDFLTYGIYESGAPTEGMHYYNFGMDHGSIALVAMAKRQMDLFSHPHYARTSLWAVHSMEPFGYAFSQHGDTPQDTGGLLGNYVMQKWVFPEEPVIDFVWRNRVRDDYSGINYRGDFLTAALFPSDWQESSGPLAPADISQWGVDVHRQRGAWEASGVALDLPLTFLCPDRGFLITRTDWTQEAMALHIESRDDLVGPGHQHASRGNFTLSALGRKWAIEHGYGISEAKHHSQVLIDGQGQGFFCPQGSLIGHLDLPELTAAAMDIAYAYNYRWTFAWRAGNQENKGFAWEPEPRRPGEKGTIRAPYNPVSYAYRSAAMVRGAHPYVLIVDDVRKDQAEHLYEWIMQVPDDLRLLQIDGNPASRIILGSSAADDQPRLLVQILEANHTEEMKREDAVVRVRLEQYELMRSRNSMGGDALRKGIGQRLVISVISDEPRFKIVLYPHRASDELPAVTLSRDAATLTWADSPPQQWQFTPGEDGRTSTRHIIEGTAPVPLP